MGFVLSMSRNLNIWDELDTDGPECSRRVAGVIRSLVNAMDLQLQSCMKH